MASATSPAAALSPARTRAVKGISWFAWVLVALVVGHDVFRLGGAGESPLITNWLQSGVFLVAGVLCLLRVAWVREERATWLALGLGILCWWPANMTYHLWIARETPIPFPSISDVFWLASYPFFYVGIVLAARRHVSSRHVGLWLDGVLGGLALAALTAAVVLQMVLKGLGGPPATVATLLAYPLADIVLLGLLAAVFVLSGRRPGWRWATMVGGMLLLFAADSIYLVQVATGSYDVGGPVEALWPIALLLPALAAWQRPDATEKPATEAKHLLALPSLFLLVAAGVLVAGHFEPLNLLAIALAGATILVAMLRTTLTVREVRALAESRRLAETDDLTGLGNRRHFFRRLEERLENAAGTRTSVTLLLIDLDRFKELNDTLGHHVGDRLLREIGRRLQLGLEPIETVARLGGDEFAILLADGIGEQVAIDVATSVRAVLAAPMSLDELSLHVDASVGIATYPDHAETGTALVQRADIAMYAAKANHGGHCVYSQDRDSHSRARLALAGELRAGIDRGEIVLHFQPKARLDSGAIAGVEALVRWQHPVHGLLPPADFLPTAEQTGLMRKLTMTVLDLALAQCSAWQRTGLDVVVGVNLSAENLLDLDFEPDIQQLLETHSADPSWLQLEITEDVLMADPEHARDVLERLRAVGMTVALDDFGTGYSSLAYIKQLTLDEVKIDRSFITNLVHDRADGAIVAATIALARSLQLRVVAEGVEDALTWTRLAALGCDLAQGYYLSAPQPASELGPWLRGRAADVADAAA